MLNFGTRRRKYLMLAAMLCACSLSAQAEGGDSELTSAQKKDFHYKLIMSEDDAVCKPLTDLYNKMLVESTKGPTTKSRYGIMTNFEMRHPERFEEIGFVEPPKQEVVLTMPPNPDAPLGWPTGTVYKEPIYLADIFNEGTPREVVYQELLSAGGALASTKITIIKKDTQYREVLTDSSSTGVDPDIVDRDASYEGLVASQNNPKQAYLGYLFSKWPNFDAMYKKYSNQMNAFKKAFDNHEKALGLRPNWSLPSIDKNSGPISTRLFMHDSRAYFVLNQYSFLAPMREESNILVYRLTPTGHEDICYINLPGKPTYARQKANGGGQ